MVEESTIKTWLQYAEREGVEQAVRKLWEIIDSERAAFTRRTQQWVEARDALHVMTYVTGDADLLEAVADEITCGGNEHSCDYVSWESDTNASNCVLQDGSADKIGCRWDAACSLRAIAKALNLKAALSSEAPSPKSEAQPSASAPATDEQREPQ